MTVILVGLYFKIIQVYKNINLNFYLSISVEVSILFAGELGASGSD